jgi:hypothetical protein
LRREDEKVNDINAQVSPAHYSSKAIPEAFLAIF